MSLTSATLPSVLRAMPVGQGIILIGGVSGPAHLIGQEAKQDSGRVASDPSHIRLVVSQLEPDSRLRLEVSGSEEQLDGRFLRGDDGSLVLHTGVDELSAPFEEIERLWTRGRSAGQGAWIGAIGGLVLGVAYGVAISEVTCAESSCTTLGLAAATGGVGAAGGAALGALVGLAIPRWKLRFP
jgi:hypothetical protein